MIGWLLLIFSIIILVLLVFVLCFLNDIWDLAFDIKNFYIRKGKK